MGAMREEAKPHWSAVPRKFQHRVEALLGSHVVRARRAFGGYGPSATFTLLLDDGRRAFLKAVYPLPEGSGVRWSLDREERVYKGLGDQIDPWAPAYRGSVLADGWHGLLLEAVTGRRFPPWTEDSAARAARAYARFHASTIGQTLPRWLPRDQHLEFVGFWQGIAADQEAFDRLTGSAGNRRSDAEAWLTGNLEALAAAETPLTNVGRPFALLHFDTRSDNIRLDGDLLRMFDWPFACVGPVEFDLAAFAQSIESEGGPAAEHVVGWYQEVLPVRVDVLIASIAAISGYFADRAPRPDAPGLPRLPSVQRCQLKASLAWAARSLHLPPPVWLAAVPD
jgi:hypothetical protein